MHHVAFFELVLGSVENLAAGNGRVDGQQGQHILKLVAEAKRSAGLVEACAAPDAAGESLVEHPAVEDQVGSRFRGMYLHGTKQMIPEHAGAFVGCTYIGGVMVFLGQCKGMFFIISLPEDEVDLFGRAGKQVEVQLQDGTRIFARGDAGFQPQAVQGSGEGGCSAASEELSAVGSQAVDCFAGNQECDSLAKFSVVGVGGQQAFLGRVILRDDIGHACGMGGAQHPFDILRGGDPAGVGPRYSLPSDG